MPDLITSHYKQETQQTAYKVENWIGCDNDIYGFLRWKRGDLVFKAMADDGYMCVTCAPG